MVNDCPRGIEHHLTGKAFLRACPADESFRQYYLAEVVHCHPGCRVWMPVIANSALQAPGSASLSK